MCNFYVILLQILWRFTGQDNTPRESTQNKVNGSFESAKERIGLNYFDKEVDVEFSKSHSKNTLTIEKAEVAQEYVPFDDEDHVIQTKSNNDKSHQHKSFDNTNPFEDEEDGVIFGNGQTKKNDKEYAKEV